MPQIIWRNLWAELSEYDKKKSIYKSSFFKGFKTPDTDVMPFDRKNFFRHFDYQIGELIPFTANPYWAQSQVHAWTKTRLPYWQRMMDTLTAEYEPLWNYNRYDVSDTVRDNTANEERTENEKVTETEDYTGSIAQTSESSQETDTKTAGYDSGSLVTSSGSDQNEEGQLNQTDTFNRSHPVATDTTENKDHNENEATNVTAHSYGNIGMTSTQQLIKKELEIAQISIYNIIIQEFKETFCLLVY